MVERNWLVLKEGVPVRVHIIDWNVAERTIRDPQFKVEKPVEGLVLLVDRVDGLPDLRTWSVLHQGLRSELEVYLQSGRYRNYEFVVTKLGARYRSTYKLEQIPLTTA